MTKFLIKSIFFLFIFPGLVLAKSNAVNILIHLNDSSRIISQEFNLPLKSSDKEDAHDKFVRLTDLNISLISYTEPGDKIKKQLSIEEIYKKIDEINFKTKIPGSGDKYLANLKFSDGKNISPNDVVFHKFKGFDQGVKNISVDRFDEYNDTWYPDYIEFSKISKIEFRKPKEAKNTTKSSSKKDKNEYKKKLLFSSDSFNMEDFEKNLKNSLLGLKNNKFQSSVVLRVNFDFNSSKLNKKSKDFLNVIANVMKSPELYSASLNLRGFTDNVGKEKYNIGLSKKRAASVKKYLIRNQNINSSRLKTSGYGESMPIAPNTSDYYKSLNRRVEILPVFYR